MASTSSKPADSTPLGVVSSVNPDAAKSDEPVKRNGVLSKLRGFWAGLAIDAPTLMVMAKGGLPPTIALSLYQITAVANTFSTLGYLVAIISIIGFAILPRAKFIQTMLMHLVALSLGAAMALLLIYSATQARLHTTPQSKASGVEPPSPGVTLVTYNSSASAVSAIWLFFQIYLINAAKAKFPQLQIPSIMYSIFTIVACTYSPQFGTMAAGISFVKRLLESFLAGLAISCFVSFFIVPVTCRKIVFKEFAGYVAALQGGLKAEQAYLHSIEDPDVFGKSIIAGAVGKDAQTPEALKVKAAIGGITALHAKLQGDLPFAKREIARGKLGPDDLKKMNKLISEVMWPVVAMGAIINVFERIALLRGWTQETLEQGLSLERQQSRRVTLVEWSQNIRGLRKSFDPIIDVMVEGLEHIAIQLQLKKLPKSKTTQPKSPPANRDEDVEAKAQHSGPGDAGFADYLDQKSQAFCGAREQTLTAWCHRHGIELPEDFFKHPRDAPFTESLEVKTERDEDHQSNQRQLYLLLYMEFLLYSASQAILDFVRFADERVESGTLSKNRLIVPGSKRIKKWVHSLWTTDDGSKEDGNGIGDLNQRGTEINLGDSFKTKKDPEHLPPTNTIQKIGDAIRLIPRALRSSESAFGFRVAAATMSVAIICFLHDTQVFFAENRLLWSMIMVAISMTPTAGQSLFNFVLRILGSAVAMVLAFLAYYIPDGHTAGTLVFVWLFTSMGLYFPLKMPQFSVIGIISVVTLTLIIGYELQVQKIGRAAATSNGQDFLPIYTLGPYRLATVSAGLFVAFFWTIFPYPMSEHSQLRQGLGGALYMLANYYSIIHETVTLRIKEGAGALGSPNSPAQRLNSVRAKVFSKQFLLMSQLKTYSNFTKWEIPIGGRFPKQQYDSITQSIEHIITYISLIGYASATFADPAAENSEWVNDFRRLLGSTKTTTHEITSMLSLLSASIAAGQPLPPYLKSPAPYGLSARLEALDHDILSIRHIGEPGYAAFAVMQISSRCIATELENLLKCVKEVVGELDFSFHVVSTSAESSASSSTLESQENSKDKSD